MGALVLVLWALLGSRGCAGRATEPGRNLSCYQCFKVTSLSSCRPAACASADRVCVSNTVIFVLRFRAGILVSKRCAPRCPNSNKKSEWLSDPGMVRRVVRQCCFGSLCNAASARQGALRAPSRGLLLPAGLSLLRAAR
uniref:UPAR/Ly6 domain-containing protein n=1 Tax=Catagonus wagneri TaxID=51154 RepID=A0A8C3W8S8_9CETA